MILRAKIPLRISFNGGGTDVDPYCSKYGGSVISSTINKYVYASLEKRNDKKIKIVSFDYNQTIQFKINDTIALTGNLKLVKAIIQYFKPYNSGFNLNIHCDAPTGSGLGTSGCLGSMLIKLISVYKNERLSDLKAGELALKIEREIVKISGGKQDQYAGLFGGMNLLNFKGGYKCKAKKIILKKNYIEELNYNCLLIYTKKKHYSNDLLSEQIKRYKKIPKTINALNEMKKINFKFINYLKMKKTYEIGKMLDKTWILKKKMNPLVTTPEVDLMYKDLKRVGVLGGKILGAGGGGFMLIILPFFLKNKAINIIQKKHKMEVEDFQFTSKGLKIWKVEKKLLDKNNKMYFL